MTIVLCSKGYLENIKKIRKLNVTWLGVIAKDHLFFHAGTKFIDNELFSNGGRVLNVTSTGKMFKNIRKNILKIIRKINWKMVSLEKILVGE